VSASIRRRTRREEVRADQLRKGDVIAPDYHDPRGGYRATVTRAEPYHRDARARAVSFDWPDDFTVNASLRGKSSARVWRNDHLVTRYVPLGTVEVARVHRSISVTFSS
jgi:hypothetical protein